jgi:putative membrane protein
MIIGFVLGSTSQIFRDKIIPSIPDTMELSWWVPAVIISIITFILGYFAILFLSRFSND